MKKQSDETPPEKGIDKTQIKHVHTVPSSGGPCGPGKPKKSTDKNAVFRKDRVKISRECSCCANEKPESHVVQHQGKDVKPS
jgi:hypothetical protein